MKSHSRLFQQIIWAVVLMTSCVSAPAPISTSFPTNDVSLTATPEPQTTYTPVPDFNNTTTFQPRNSEEMQAFVMFHLNQGKEISEIDSFFDRFESRNAWTDGRAIDFDGDGENELFLIASVYIESLGSSENIFWVAKGTQQHYEVVYSKSEIASYGARIEFIDDLNGDSLQDLIFTRALYGNGAGDEIFIVQLENSNFIIHQVAETSLIIDKIRAENHDTSGTKNLVVIGFEYGWMSAGPGRTIEEIYSVTGEQYSLVQSHDLPDNYRIHVLEDAQIAYNSGNEKLAVELWEQAAYDQSLINFPSMWIESDIPEKYQPAFAVYRLYTYFLSVNDLKNAQTYWTELNNQYPQDSPGGEFIELANEAKRLLEKSRDPIVVCDGIYDFLNSTTENVNFLMDHWQWGDLNRDIVDFCPLRRE